MHAPSSTGHATALALVPCPRAWSESVRAARCPNAFGAGYTPRDAGLGAQSRERKWSGDHQWRGAKLEEEAMLFGLPDGTLACLFDMDGVLTDTATVHTTAWKETFDKFLQSAAAASGSDLRPFSDEDYARYVDGKPRVNGVRDFLVSRGINLPEGQPDDPPGTATITGVGNAKNTLVQQMIEHGGVAVFEGTIDYVQKIREAGLVTAVVSSSANAVSVLSAAGISDLFDVRVDGIVALEHGLPGKPYPDTYLFAAEQLSVQPQQAAVFEDALSGVQAGRAGGFALVVGVDRLNQEELLRQNGADVVVKDVAYMLDSV